MAQGGSRKARTSLTYDLETLLRVAQGAGFKEPLVSALRTLMDLGWDHADTARLLGFGLTQTNGVRDFGEQLNESVRIAQSLSAFGVRAGEKALQTMTDFAETLGMLRDPEHLASAFEALGRSKSIEDALAIASTVQEQKVGFLSQKDLTTIFSQGPADSKRMRALVSQVPEVESLCFATSLLGVMSSERAVLLTHQLYLGKARLAGAEMSSLVVALADLPDAEISRFVDAILGTSSMYQGGLVVEYATSVIRSGERDLESVVKLCRRFMTMDSAWSWRGSLAELHEAGFAPPDALAFVNALALSEKLSGNTRATKAILSLAKEKNADKKAIKEALSFVYSFGGSEVAELALLCRDTKLELADLQASKIAKALAVALKPEHASLAAVVLNALHEGEGRELHTDRIRAEIISGLTKETIYAILSEGSETLFTSTYLLLIARLKRSVGDLPAWLGDKPAGFDGFFATLARFGQLDVLLETAALSVGVIETELRERSDLVSKASRDVKVVTAILRAGDPLLVKRLEALMLEQKDVPAVAFILRQAFQDGLLKDPALIAIASSYPAIVGNAPPVARWTADGVVSAKLVFYPDEYSFDESIVYFKKLGFNITRDGKDHAVIERMRSGVIQRLDLTRDPKADRQSAFDPKAFDIVAHRGHSYHFSETFVANGTPDDDNPQLLFGGSCGSFRSMTSSQFLDTYGRQYLLSDQNTGEGPVNNRVLVQLLNGIADKKAHWEDFGFDQVGDKGIVLPNDPAHLAHAYAVSFERWRAVH